MRKKSLFSWDGIGNRYSAHHQATLFHGDALSLLEEIPVDSVQLFVTSPPYNIGKRYESRSSLDDYIALQDGVISACVQRLAPGGSICWQVGNHVKDNVVTPLDILLYPLFAKHGLVLRNRIVWHFEHGLHCGRRLSGRHETILWFTRPADDYTFHLDDIRVPQKYPGKKHFKGPRTGQYSGNPLGKNPGDVWIIPNVKHNHVEKTEHPCQFPVELVERLILALTSPGDLVVDPFMGVGTTNVAATLAGRRSAGSDTIKRYVEIASERVSAAAAGALRIRPRTRPVYTPQGSITRSPFEDGKTQQLPLAST
jgi:adenine-specific DNA-methyltransferase